MSDDYEISSNGEEFTYNYWVKQYNELKAKLDDALQALEDIERWYDGHNNIIAHKMLLKIRGAK